MFDSGTSENSMKIEFRKDARLSTILFQIHMALSVGSVDGQEQLWVASEGRWNSATFEFQHLRDCFVSSSNILQDGWHGWFVNQSHENEAPEYSDRMLTCLSKWLD